jgi:hypothetical protein
MYKLMKKHVEIATFPVIAIALMLGTWFGCSEDGSTGPASSNHRPIVSLQTDTSGVVGDTLRLIFTASDQDSNSFQGSNKLRFHLIIHCTWTEIKQRSFAHAHVDSYTGAFWFYPRTYDMPLRQFSVWVDDDRGGTDTTTFNVSVVP